MQLLSAQCRCNEMITGVVDAFGIPWISKPHTPRFTLPLSTHPTPKIPFPVVRSARVGNRFSCLNLSGRVNVRARTRICRISALDEHLYSGYITIAIFLVRRESSKGMISRVGSICKTKAPTAASVMYIKWKL